MLEFNEEGKQWTLLKQAEAECECDECLCGGIFPEGSAILLSEELAKMSAWPQIERYLNQNFAEEKSYTLVSRDVPGARLEINIQIGDTAHVMDAIKVTLPSGKTLNIVGCEGNKQLAFREELGFLLAGSEYSMICPKLIDLRDGRAHPLPAGVKDAVWVRRPQ